MLGSLSEAGAVVTVHGKSIAVIGLTVVNDRIVAIDALADPKRVGALDLGFLDDRSG
jgi:hypothetical protein